MSAFTMPLHPVTGNTEVTAEEIITLIDAEDELCLVENGKPTTAGMFYVSSLRRMGR